MVDRPATNPDCSGRRVVSRRGLMRAKRTCAKTFPGTDRRVQTAGSKVHSFGQWRSLLVVATCAAPLVSLPVSTQLQL